MFALLNDVQTDNEDETNELINDFDTEFKAPEEIKLSDNEGNVSALTWEATFCVVDQGTAQTKELETNKKRKKARRKDPDLETQHFFTEWRILCTWAQNCKAIWGKCFRFRYLWTNY